MSIKLEKIWFRYPKNPRWILRNLSLRFREGEITVIVGPNGSGKTTLLKIASLIYEPTRGLVEAWGKNFWSLRKHERINLRRKLVYVHEKPILLKGTALNNVAYGLLLRGMTKEESLKLAEDLITRIGIGYLKEKHSNMLSAGEAQLISLLRAIAVNPSLLFLDEPMAHLDSRKRQIMISIIKNLGRNGAGIIIATHDFSLAQSLANKVIILEEGKITSEGGSEVISEYLRQKV